MVEFGDTVGNASITGELALGIDSEVSHLLPLLERPLVFAGVILPLITVAGELFAINTCSFEMDFP